MVRKLLILFLLLAIPFSFIFSQNDVLKQAKATFKKGDVKELQKMVDKIIVDPSTKNDPDTWYVSGRVQQRKAEQQMEKAYLRKPYDTLTIYNSVLNMTQYFLRCDSLAQLETKPGKINKYRKDMQQSILADKGNLLNGGIYYYNHATEGDTVNLSKARDFFGTYVDATMSDMFALDNLLPRDSVFSQVAYYASLAAVRIGDYPSVLKYAPYAEDDATVGQYAMEFLAQAYKQNGNTTAWIETLKRAIEKHPQDDYFFANLIDYYGSQDKYDEALEFANGMLAKAPGNYYYLFVKGFLYHSMKRYNDALAYYKRSIKANPDYAEAYSNVGLVYCLQAQDFSQEAVTDIKDPRYPVDQAQLKSYYENALPYYEKARELKPNDRTLWLNGLHRVYYNLSMGDKFNEIDALINNQ
ncbi:MAG: tetratricopeptide repeat protein [Bacteroidaceae bacterium]|nr:tetratricopeptide repeat protein [Bacteroidaceae bacterium]